LSYSDARIPEIPKRQWPAVRFKDKRAITLEEHQKIIATEMNLDRKALYQLCCHLGARQGDIAALRGENMRWAGRLGHTLVELL
jgi:hypothetical protein